MTRSIAEAAEASLRMVREAKELSYDTETSGLDWKRNSPIGYVIGDGDSDVVYIPIRHGGGGNLPDRNTRPLKTPTDPLVVHKYETALAKAFKFRQSLPKERGLIVGHHLKFDCHFSARAGVLLGRNLTCTQNNEALLDEYTKGFSLFDCAERHGVQAKKSEEMYQHLASLFNVPANKDSMEHFWRTAGDDEIVVDYATGDGVSTYQLFLKQREELLKPDDQGFTMQAVWELENRLIWTLFRMENRGIKIDEEYLEKLMPMVNAKVDEAMAKLPKDFNVRSGPQVKAYIESSGRTDWPTTELGNPSFTEKWLKTFPEGKNIITVRKWSNLGNTFVTPMIERHMFEGRVYTQINQLKADDLGTVSGRLSFSAPNLTQLPKRDKEVAKMFRRLFIADEGMEFYEADWSQCEPRLFAHYSGEPVLVEGYNQEPFRDVHDAVATLLGVERDPTGKRVNMGMFTGMYPKTFSEHMGWDLGRATEMWNAWQAAFPGIAGFQADVRDVFIDRGYVRTLLGRRGRIENRRLAYKGVSKIIQGGNADILKYKMVELDEQFEAEGDETNLLATVHDAFELQAPKTPKGAARMERVWATLIDVQGPPFNLRVPFAVDTDHGHSWAEATFGPESSWK